MRTQTVAKADLVAALRDRLGAALHGPAESLAVSIEGLTLRPEAGAHYGLARDAEGLRWVLTYDPSDPDAGEAMVRRGIVVCLLSRMGLTSAMGQTGTHEIVEALWAAPPIPMSSRTPPANDGRCPQARRA